MRDVGSTSRWPLLLALVVVAALASSGCEAVKRWRDEPLQDQISIQPHERPLDSVPAGVEPMKHRGGGWRVAAEIEPARTPEEAKRLRNPFHSTPSVLEAGKIGYGRYCSHCHGDLGYGWTSVGSSLDPRPPDLTKAIIGKSDGEIFSVITFGTDAEPRVPIALGATVSVDDRWRIIRYIRTLPAEHRGKAPHWDQRILRD